MRTDGTFIFYIIQHKNILPDNSGKWATSSLDHFGCPDGFSASGECWQKTGVHGVFDSELGKKGVMELSAKHLDINFRLCRRMVTMQTEEVFSCAHRSETDLSLL